MQLAKGKTNKVQDGLPIPVGLPWKDGRGKPGKTGV